MFYEKVSIIKQWIISLIILMSSTAIGILFQTLKFTESNIITVYILGVLLTALFTRNYVCSAVSSLSSVLLFNFFFTEPRLTFHAYESGYPVTFGIMLVSSLITGTLANKAAEYAKQSAEAEALAKNEQLRANLLRAISHDLRTPLTSISGNVENLLVNDEVIEKENRKEILIDIYDDAMWLIQLVENLLSITRIEEGKMKLNLSAQLVDEVVTESLKHINRKSMEHTISTDIKDDLMLAHIDARLISQVIINLVDNAIKYTQVGSSIHIVAEKKDSWIFIQVIDNGAGISDKNKARVFEMFFTGEEKVVDCHRSLGLGLSLCRSIIHAHGGEITLTDNIPNGCIFTFTIPVSEVTLNE